MGVPQSKVVVSLIYYSLNYQLFVVYFYFLADFV